MLTVTGNKQTKANGTNLLINKKNPHKNWVKPTSCIKYPDAYKLSMNCWPAGSEILMGIKMYHLFMPKMNMGKPQGYSY